jgi:hypothetical protein
MPFVIMRSEEFGEEEFEYETLKEAKEGFKRLKKSTDQHATEDGIERTLLLVLDTYSTTANEDDEEEKEDDEDEA